MNETEALAKMVYPNQRRPRKTHGGTIQIWLTRACDMACFGCTQGANQRPHESVTQKFITVAQFEQAVVSLEDYFGTVGIFGGNPALHPDFNQLCEILAGNIPFERRGLWCNHPRGHGRIMARTFNPTVSNLNVHLNAEAHAEFKRDWPESRPFGLTQDSRHSPPFVAIQDLVEDDEDRWKMISECDINQHWSAMIGVFRGELRAWFCEIAGAQSIMHQHEPGYPDTGVPLWFDGYTDRLPQSDTQYADGEKTAVEPMPWWKFGASDFAHQVRYHCHACGVPLRGRGELAQAEDGVEQVTRTHADVFKPKRKDRAVQLVVCPSQLGAVKKMTDYLGNAKQ